MTRPEQLESESDYPINPVDFVRRGKPKYKGIGRVVAIAEGAKDAFSIGEAVVDGVMFVSYATMARRAMNEGNL